MIAIKKILLPADASECSKKALAYALSFAKQYKARLVGLHVIDQRWEEQARDAFAAIGQDAIQTVRQGYEEEARRILQEVADVAAQAGIAVETRIVTGLPFEEIVRVGRELPADIIIMGTHGRTGVSHALLGSVAENVVRNSPCPVLVVRLEEGELVAP